MSTKTKRALDALMDLTPDERGMVLCWFCDACHVHIGPGESHACPVGSTVYPPTDSPVGEPEVIDDDRAAAKRIVDEWDGPPFYRDDAQDMVATAIAQGRQAGAEQIDEARRAAESLRKTVYDWVAEDEGEGYGSMKEEMRLPWE